jgi:microcystin-dependent protein
MLKKVKQILGLTQSEPTLGSIELWAGYRVPKCFARCEGQKMSIKDNAALFSIIGTIYGGDGVQYFTLPDYRPRDAKGNIISWDKADTPMVLICIYGVYPSWDY